MKRTSFSCSLSSLALLTCLLVTPAVGRADHWERIHDIPSQGLSYFVDTESIVVQGSIVRAWDRVVFTRPKSDSQSQLIFSQKYYKSYDCEERLSRNIQSIDYADRDSTAVVGEITHYSATWPLNTAASGSAEEKLINFICNTAAKKLRTGR
jgi:hypothetical protein